MVEKSDFQLHSTLSLSMAMLKHLSRYIVCYKTLIGLAVWKMVIKAQKRYLTTIQPEPLYMGPTAYDISRQ